MLPSPNNPNNTHTHHLQKVTLVPVWVCVGAVVRNNMKTNLLMNSIKFQHTKSIYENQVHFYTPTMHYLKKKLRKQSHNRIKKNKIFRNKPNQREE